MLGVYGKNEKKGHNCLYKNNAQDHECVYTYIWMCLCVDVFKMCIKTL